MLCDLLSKNCIFDFINNNYTFVALLILKNYMIMKKIILLLAIMSMAFSFSMNAQEQLPKKEYVYCEIVGFQKLGSYDKCKIYICYGDTENEDLETKSMILALNQMVSRGWELVEPYMQTSATNVYIFRYLMKKEVDPKK